MASIISASTTSATALNMSADTTGVLQLATGATPTTAVTIDTSQNVGIGTTSPSAKLDVQAGSTSLPTYVGSIRVGAYGAQSLASNGGIEFASATAGLGYGWRIGGIDLGSNNVPFVWESRSSSASWTERMRIDSSGNVGIGTTSPSYLLNVSKNGGGGDSAQFVRITDTSTSNSIGPLHLTIGAANHFAVNPSPVLCGTNGIAFGVGDGSDLATQRKMTIDSSGNVGIGISNPGARLDVRASGTNGIDVRTTNSADGIYGVFNTSGSSSTAVYVFPMRFGSTSTLIGGIYYNGSVLSLQGTSDERLKENIVDSSSGLDKLKNIKVRSFDWKDGRGHVDFGVIAQELNEIAPEAVVVGKDNEDGTIETPWSADASLLVPVLIKAIQEQQTIINDLKARVTALEAK